jgi:hypothetical protein
MIQTIEKINIESGYGFCIIMSSNSIRCYIIKRWHPVLVRKVIYNGRKIIDETIRKL